jgi:hypothetical protein
LTIGAYRRDEIPMGCIETTDMLVFGVSTNETELG